MRVHTYALKTHAVIITTMYICTDVCTRVRTYVIYIYVPWVKTVHVMYLINTYTYVHDEKVNRMRCVFTYTTHIRSV